MRALAVLGTLGLLAASGPSPAPVSPGEPRNALERLARQVAAELSRHAPEGPVAVFTRAESADLERAFSALLCAELSRRGLGAFAFQAPGPEAAEPAARERGARSLARVTLSLEHGLLYARGDLFGTWVNFWSGRVPTRPAQPAAALAESTEADAHALALAAQPLPPAAPIAPAAPASPGRLELQGTTLLHLPLPTAALAAFDLDGDGRDELLALTDEELIALSADGTVLARRDLRALPPSPTPCREAAGALAVYRNPLRVAWFSAGRARGEVLEYDKVQRAFRPVAPLDEAPLGGGEAVLSGQLLPGQSAFAPEVSVPGRSRVPVGGPFVTLSLFPSPAGPEALVVFPGGAAARLHGLPPASPADALAGLGAGSALVDLDGDGRPEVVTSSPQYAPEPDELRVLDAAGKAVLWQGTVPHGRVLQVAGVGLDKGRGLALGVWLPDGTAELQLFRRTP